MPELLSPAGNFEKMKAALRYGADAVYMAGKRFGMRSAAENFTDDELREAIAYAHAIGKKVHITVNTLPRTGEYTALRDYFDFSRFYFLLSHLQERFCPKLIYTSPLRRG